MDDARKNEIFAVIFFALTLFLFLSIFTFTEQDIPFYTSDPNVILHNLAGVVGAYVSGFFRFLLGKGAYVIPLLTLAWGLSRLFQFEPRKVFFKVFGTIFLVTAVSASMSMASYSTRALAFSRGGLVGTVVSEFLLEYLGRAGAVLVISATIILSILIATEFLLLPIIVGVFKFLSDLYAKTFSLAQDRTREALARKRQRAPVINLSEEKKKVSMKLEAIRKQVQDSRSSTIKPRRAEEEARKETVSQDVKVSVAREGREEVKPKPPRVVSVPDSATGSVVEYKLPGLDLLKVGSKLKEREREEALKAKAALLERTLAEFGVLAKVVKINCGPVITMYELEPSVGTKVAKITSLGDNISLAMRSANIRIVAPLPGKGTIGIEVPNEKSELVLLRGVIESSEYQDETSPLKIALGKDISGDAVVMDLAKMPHLLIAGTTGSGKTVCINCIISSMLLNSSPQELKFLMVDPKRVELMMFEGIPHLISPIVTNPKKVGVALGWVIGEMERRYDLFAEKGTRNISAYKEKAEKDWENLPYIVIIIDELADLMQVSQQDIEGSIMRLAQLSRAAGIHMILATQRPSVNVITGVIKANFPARISFKVASKVDSRTVLDTNGAEKLLGRGDMLLMEPGRGDLLRGQCSLVEDGEIRNIVKFIKTQSGPLYYEDLMETQEKKGAVGAVAEEDEELFREAVKIVVGTKQASVSMLQRKLRVGYSRAARLIDLMEERGVVGPYNGSKPRDILIENPEELGS